MDTHLDENIDQLRHLTTAQLRSKYLELFGQPSHSNHKGYLFRRLAWRLQAFAQGEACRSRLAATPNRSPRRPICASARPTNHCQLNHLGLLLHHRAIRVSPRRVPCWPSAIRMM